MDPGGFSENCLLPCHYRKTTVAMPPMPSSPHAVLPGPPSHCSIRRPPDDLCFLSCSLPFSPVRPSPKIELPDRRRARRRCLPGPPLSPLPLGATGPCRGARNRRHRPGPLRLQPPHVIALAVASDLPGPFRPLQHLVGELTVQMDTLLLPLSLSPPLPPITANRGRGHGRRHDSGDH